MTERASSTIFHDRADISDILHGKDHRLLVVLGPCSIHDTKAAREYATLLKSTIDELSTDLRIVMRVYFEKPRKTNCAGKAFTILDGLRWARRRAANSQLTPAVISNTVP
jgi:3-deoxy-7-phosphoheptulonate synthase